MLPGQHLPPALGTFHSLGRCFCSRDSAFYQCPSCLLSCAFKQWKHLCAKDQSLHSPCASEPQIRPGWDCGPPPPRWKTCLKTRLWNSSQKDETQIKRHLTQGMVWNKDPGLCTLVASSWSTKVEGEGPGRDCPTAIQRISGPVLGTFCTQVRCQFDGFGLIMYFHHVPNKRELCGSIYERAPNTLGDCPCLQRWPHHENQVQLRPYQVACEKNSSTDLPEHAFSSRDLGSHVGSFLS